MRTVRLDEGEAAVAPAVASQRFPVTEPAAIRDEVRRVLVKMQSADTEEKDSLRAWLRTLEEQEDRLIELITEGTIASSKLRNWLKSVKPAEGRHRRVPGPRRETHPARRRHGPRVRQPA